MFKKGRLKSITTFLLALTMSVGMFSISAQAATGITAAEKTAMKQADDTYEVKIQVPGKDGDNRHDEVILMVDGSYSLDEEWPAMKEAINTIGETVLNGSGSTMLTLMAFGMGDNEVLVHVKDAAELAAALGELPGSLLYGRSSTNCEAGFTGVAEYIQNHDETLRDVNVIFISDGNVNTDETPRAFDSNWKAWATQFGALTVAQAAFEGTLLYGENLPAAFTAVFGDRFADAEDGSAIIERAFGGEVSDDEFLAFADRIWADVYAYSGLTPGAEYSVSDAERAFVKYDKENGTYIQDAFYYTTYKSSYVTYPDRWTRTPIAADELAAMDQVKSMYVVDYDSKSAWMDTGITSKKSTFIKSNGIAGLCEALKGALATLGKTPFNDVVITDYMSKWVNVDTTSLRIVDNKTNQVIWNATEEWKITDNRPTAQENPVIVELVPAEEYAAGGSDVIGNSNGDIYKFTWYVKDGAMLRSDSYSLVYDVTVDTEEFGFVYGQSYPANGTTVMEYKDENGQDQKEDIEVPPVSARERILNITKSTVIGEGDNAEIKPLEGITFDIYYAGTVDEYTKYVERVAKTYGGAPEDFQAAVQEKFALAKADEVAAGALTPVETVTTDLTGKAVYNITLDGQSDGIYLLIEREHPAIVAPLAPFIVAVPMTNAEGTDLEYMVTINPKNEVLPGPEVEKNVTEIGTDLDSFDVGDTHTWILRGDVPVDIANGKYYIMEDVLDYRLDYQGNVKVVVGTDNLLAGEETIALTAGRDYTLTIGTTTDDAGNTVDTFTVELTADGMTKVAEATAANTVDANADNKADYKDMEIRVYFDSVITQNAVVGTEIPNVVTLDYLNSVGIDFEDKDDAKVYTCGINIKKYDAKETTTFLKGAEFMVARKATDAEIADETIKTENLVIARGQSEVVVFVDFYDNAALTGEKVNTIVTNATGDAIVYGLGEGTYYLVETKAPAGYNLLSYPVNITLNKVSHVADNTVGVANSNSFVLPGTGGIGTTIFTLVGAALTLGSGAVLVGKKRKEE